MNFNEEAKELLKTDDGAKSVIVAGRVFSPHTFSAAVPDFTARQYVFLRHFSMEMPFEEAASKADMTLDEAERFLEKPKVRAWLADRAEKAHIKKEWEVPGKWYAEGDRLFHEEKVPKHKIEIWKTFGDRVAPAKRLNEGQAAPSITFNFGADAVKAALDRQKAIEAEISQ